jgi:hypothetical protein
MDQWLGAQRTCQAALYNQKLRNAYWAPFYGELQGLFDAGLDPDMRIKELVELNVDVAASKHHHDKTTQSQ